MLKENEDVFMETDVLIKMSRIKNIMFDSYKKTKEAEKSLIEIVRKYIGEYIGEDRLVDYSPRRSTIERTLISTQKSIYPWFVVDIRMDWLLRHRSPFNSS